MVIYEIYIFYLTSSFIHVLRHAHYRLLIISGIKNTFGNVMLMLDTVKELVFAKIKSANGVALKVEDDRNLNDANKDNKVEDKKRR